eukprot:COSAG01_NODE_216_length_21695_cov_83.368772_8_plen_178_part_00
MRLLIFSLCLFMGVLAVSLQAKEALKLVSDAIEYDAKTRLMKASQGVYLFYNGYQLKGESAVYDQVKARVEIRDDVELIGGDVNLSCKRMVLYTKEDYLKASEDIVFLLHEESADVERMQGQCGTLMFRFNEERLVLSQSPFLIQGDRRIQGDRIFVDLKSGKYVVKGNVELNMGVQ